MRHAAIIFTLLPGSAAAHPGHFADLAGHDHLIALGALAIAGAITAAALIKKLRGEEADDADEATEEAAEAPEEQPA